MTSTADQLGFLPEPEPTPARQAEDAPPAAVPAGGDFVVTLTHTVQVRIPDLAVVASATGLPPLEAIVELADRVVAVNGVPTTADHLDGLPRGAVEVIRVERPNTDVDRVERWETSGGREWLMHTPVMDGDRTVGRPTTFLVTHDPLTERQALDLTRLVRDGVVAAAIPAPTPKGHQ